MDYHSFKFSYHYLLMLRLYFFMGTDRAIISDWVMVAQFRTAKDILDKRNRLINEGHNPKDISIVRLKGDT